MSTRIFGRPRPPAYREPPPYGPGEILFRVAAFALLALSAFLIFNAFAG